MSHSTHDSLLSADHVQAEIEDCLSAPDSISDDDIDYAALAAESEEGSISFSASDYASDDAMMNAVEAFIMKCWDEATNEAVA